MSTSKGKGKASASIDEETQNAGEDDAPSMLSRIAASANGLTRDAFSGSKSNETLATTLTNSGKGESYSVNRSGSSAWAESSKANQPSHFQAGSVRLGHSEEHVQKSEEDFSSFLNGIDSFSSSEPSGTIGADSYKDIGRTWGEAWAHAQTIETPEFIIPDPANRTVAEHEAQDGQEVSDLLSSPGWISQEFEAPPPDVEGLESYDWGLSQEQISEIQVMTRHLVPPESHAIVNIDHPLNLIPDLDAEGRSMWVEQWEDVLTRYTDEVWGGLLPLVKEARKEVEEVKIDDTVPVKPTAVRRLEAILKHMQQH